MDSHFTPAPPRITPKLLLRQFWLDVYGKEIQSAATYSYLWMADQTGHICVGILLFFLLTSIFGYLLGYGSSGAPIIAAQILGVVCTALIVSYWEYRAYRSDVHRATGVFPLGVRLLRDNAIIAATYMIVGGFVGWALYPPTSWPAFIVLLIVAIVLAPWWLRQKIIWQKAGLPYLFRLADAKHTVLEDAAEALQLLIDEAAPPGSRPRQVVIAGPIGSGRTSLASGVGTEFAFRNATVRYLSFGNLIEFAMSSKLAEAPPDVRDSRGPTNIGYWHWARSQVLIIDDIGPLTATPEGHPDAGRFKALLAGPLREIAGVLATRHTVWVLGDLGPAGPTLIDEFAKAVADLCRAARPLTILLSRVPEEAPPTIEGRGRRLMRWLWPPSPPASGRRAAAAARVAGS